MGKSVLAAPFVLSVPLALVVASLGAALLAPSLRGGSDGIAAGLLERLTREESVSIRIDAERRMVVDTATPPAPGRPSHESWLVLERRWLDGEGAAAAGGSVSYIGAVMNADSHIAITPPFVVLTRGDESVLLRLDGGRVADAGGPTPDWIRADAERGTILARFDGLSDVEIGADTVRLQRRFFGW